MAQAEALLYGLLVERLCFPLLQPDGVLGAVAKARAKTVAEVVGDEPGLAIDDLDCTLRARRHALAAPVAPLRVYVNDQPLGPVGIHVLFPPQSSLA
jgi:hypothetical protein